MDYQVADGCDRQIELQWLPMAGVVKGNINTEFRGGEQQAAALRIFANRVEERPFLDAAHDFSPGLTEIAGAIEMRAIIFDAMAVDRRVRGRRIEMRGFDVRDLAPIREPAWSDVRPSLAAVFGEMNEAGIAA